MKTKRPKINSSKERADRGKKPYNPPRIGKHPYVENLEKRVAFRFGRFIAVLSLYIAGVIMFGSAVQAARKYDAQHSRAKKAPVSSTERIVNDTLDTVMWVHEQHQGKMTWAQLNAEVCKHMKVKRTEPWQRK